MPAKCKSSNTVSPMLMPAVSKTPALKPQMMSVLTTGGPAIQLELKEPTSAATKIKTPNDDLKRLSSQ